MFIRISFLNSLVIHWFYWIIFNIGFFHSYSMLSESLIWVLICLYTHIADWNYCEYILLTRRRWYFVRNWLQTDYNTPHPRPQYSLPSHCPQFQKSPSTHLSVSYSSVTYWTRHQFSSANTHYQQLIFPLPPLSDPSDKNFLQYSNLTLVSWKLLQSVIMQDNIQPSSCGQISPKNNTPTPPKIKYSISWRGPNSTI